MARLKIHPSIHVRLVSLEDRPEIFEGWVEAFNENSDLFLVRAQTPRSPTIRYRIHPTLVQVKPGQRISFRIQVKIKLDDDYSEPPESELRFRLSFVSLAIPDQSLSTKLLWDGIPASERENVTLSLILTRSDTNLNAHETAIRASANDCDPIDYLDEFPVDLDAEEEDLGVIDDQYEQDLGNVKRGPVPLGDFSSRKLFHPTTRKRQDIRDQFASLSQSLENAKAVRAIDREKGASEHQKTNPVCVPKSNPEVKLQSKLSEDSSVLEARIRALEMDFKNLQSEIKMLNLTPQVNEGNAASLDDQETRGWREIISNHWGMIYWSLLILVVAMIMRFGPPFSWG